MVVDLIEVPKELKYRRIFINKLSELLKIPQDEEKEEEKVRPQKEKEYKQLRKTKMKFGQHKGEAYDDIPLKYLDWLCGEMEDDLATLQEYLKHPDTKRLRSGELDDE